MNRQNFLLRSQSGGESVHRPDYWLVWVLGIGMIAASLVLSLHQRSLDHDVIAQKQHEAQIDVNQAKIAANQVKITDLQQTIAAFATQLVQARTDVAALQHYAQELQSQVQSLGGTPAPAPSTARPGSDAESSPSGNGPTPTPAPTRPSPQPRPTPTRSSSPSPSSSPLLPCIVPHVPPGCRSQPTRTIAGASSGPTKPLGLVLALLAICATLVARKVI